jgi:hypothetical protein
MFKSQFALLCKRKWPRSLRYCWGNSGFIITIAFEMFVLDNDVQSMSFATSEGIEQEVTTTLLSKGC